MKNINEMSYQELENAFSERLIQDLNKCQKGHYFPEDEIENFSILVSPEMKRKVLKGEDIKLSTEDNYKDKRNDSYNSGVINCENCGRSVNVWYFKGELYIYDECDFEYKDLEVVVDFSSGKVVNADYLVTIAEHIANKGTYSFKRSFKAIFKQLEHYAEYKVFFPSIPNGQPSVYEMDDGSFVFAEGSNSGEEDVVLWDGNKPILERGGCFFMDYEKAMKFKEAFEILEEDFDGFDDIDELEHFVVPAGKYKCILNKRAVYNRNYVDNEVFMIAKMVKID